MRLAWFVSPHGFGHAARSCAVLEALRALDPALEVTLYTSVPRWFFEESLEFPFVDRELVCDVGMVQRSALEEDLPATVERLETFWEEAKGVRREELHQQLRASRADAVVCDIAPLGLLAARDAGLPSILIESFTWDWIYEPLVEPEPRFAPWIERLRELFALADLRIQAEPVCDPLGAPPPRARAIPSPDSCFPSMEVSSSSTTSSSSRSTISLVRVPPIARRPRSSGPEVRARLGLAPVESGRPMILISMGGIPWSFENLDRWRAAEEYDFVVPGGSSRGTGEVRRGNLALLPHHSPVYHPDLVAAADLVVGKLGYSTVAEAVTAGSRILFLPRTTFREHGVLARFVRSRLPAREVSLEQFLGGAWIRELPSLLAEPRPERRLESGAPIAATAIERFLAGR